MKKTCANCAYSDHCDLYGCDAYNEDTDNCKYFKEEED